MLYNKISLRAISITAERERERKRERESTLYVRSKRDNRFPDDELTMMLSTYRGAALPYL